ncbi:MAG: cytochrome C [Nitrospirae bacterium]|nr:cytochrome C [Nitrospirota bacterium]
MSTRQKVSVIVFLILVTFSINAYAGDTSYTAHIKPIFDAKCIGCHGPDAAPEYDAFKQEKDKWLAKGKGMRLDTYSHLIFYTAWPDAGALMRRLDDGKNTKDRKPGNMYQYLGATEEERQKNLKIFREWVGNWTLKKWPEITKEDMNGIKVKY